MLQKRSGSDGKIEKAKEDGLHQPPHNPTNDSVHQRWDKLEGLQTIVTFYDAHY